LVGRYLTGEFGPHRDISPYLISLAYAADRAQVAPTLHAWIRKGYWIVSNRYTSANFAHQGSKFATPAQRRAYWTWLDELEYTQGNLPREDMVLYLDVPPRVSQTLLDKKNTRTYLGTQQKDTAEMDVAHQEATRRVYHTLAKTRLGWHRLPCVNRKGQLLTVEEIHAQIITLVSP
jgi:dTMP kinase